MFSHSPNKGLKLKLMMTSSCRRVSDEGKRRYKELRRMKEKIRVEESMKFDFMKPASRTAGTAELYRNLQQYPYPLKITKGEKKDTTIPMPKTYCPLFTETHWYEWWEKEKYFQSSNESPSSKRKFSMVIPPPNVTGRLHMGHALTTTIEDIMARWHRMLGDDVVWLPGSDHAGIATQVIVEKFIKKELGETKHSLGARQFREAIWKWKDKKGVEIYEQLRRIGASLDWSRTCFTLDEHYYNAVIEAFVRLHEQGLIYRAEKMINWSPHMSTSLSDIEVEVQVLDDPVAMKIPGYEYPVQFGILHKFAYKLQDPIDGIDEVVVATSRVETLFGDVAVAVNPSDERYKKLIGRRLVHPFFLDRKVLVVGDSEVDITKGTGAVKITPAHDRVDFEIGSRHRLPKIESVDHLGKIVIDKRHSHAIFNKYNGMQQFDARNKIINHLVDLKLYRGQMKYQAVARFCGRTGDVIEPRIKRQWFVKVDEMCRKSLEAVKDGKLEFVQDKYVNSWSSWLESADDWCVSRSLWWGHHIPAYKVTTTNGTSEWVVARNEEEARSKARVKLGLSSTDHVTMKRDSDVLDTWFSSAIFPFAAFGWPDNNVDLNKYYPLNVMETGHDLLFFWVARMTMMGIQLTGQVPFKQVLFHPMVCDDYGRKMSKSLGNVIDPMHVVDGCTMEEKMASVADMCLDEKENKLAVLQMKNLYHNIMPASGSDSLRHSLCMHSLQKDHIDYSVKQTMHSRRFLNKMWNSFLLVTLMIKDDRLLREKMSDGGFEEEMKNHLQDTDWWINTKLYDVIEESEKYLQSHQYSLYLSNVQHFWANYVCDWYLEACKNRFRRDYDKESQTLHMYSDNEENAALQLNLIRIADSFLRLLHPVLPFITEELWQRIPASFILGYNKPDSICISPYPVPANNQDLFSDRSASERVEQLLHLVALYRSMREMYTIPRNSKVAFQFKDETAYQRVAQQTQLLNQLIANFDFRLLAPSSGDDDVIKSGYIALRSEVEPFDIFFRPESMADYVGNANVDAYLRKRLKNLKKKTPGDARIRQIEQVVEQRKLLMTSLE